MIEVAGYDPAAITSAYTYYVGLRHPESGQLAPAGTRLDLPVFHLVELAPSPGLVDGLDASRLLLAMLASGALASRRRQDLATWVEGQPTPGRRLRAERAIADAVVLLRGAHLEEAEDVYRSRYQEELGQPPARAALVWLRTLLRLGQSVRLLDDQAGSTAAIAREVVLSPSSPTGVPSRRLAST